MENSMKNNDEIEIDLRQIFIVILSKIAIILLVGVIFGLAAFIGSKLLLKPVYHVIRDTSTRSRRWIPNCPEDDKKYWDHYQLR